MGSVELLQAGIVQVSYNTIEKGVEVKESLMSSIDIM